MGEGMYFLCLVLTDLLQDLTNLDSETGVRRKGSEQLLLLHARFLLNGLRDPGMALEIEKIETL